MRSSIKVILSFLIIFLLFCIIKQDIHATSGNTLTIVFDANGGQGKMKKQKISRSAGFTAPDCSFTFEGHSFTGWSTHPYSQDGSVDYLPGSSVDIDKLTINKKKAALYACWKNNSPADLYVSVGGSDSNPGTSDSPFATIGHALSLATGGSRIHILPGTYRETLTFEKSGDNREPIILIGEGRDPDGTPSAKLTSDGGEQIYLLNLNGQSNYRFVNLDIGNIEAKYACGIYIPENSKNIGISGNNIHDIKVSPAYIQSPEKDEKNAGEANAILCLGEGKKLSTAVSAITICDNTISENVTNWSETLSVAGNCEDIRVYGNRIHDNTNIGIDFNGNMGYCPKKKLDQPRNCEAYGNTVYNCHCDYASCAGIYADGAIDTKIHDNEVYNCDYGIEIGAEAKKRGRPVKNISVEKNFLHDNPKGGIWIGGYEEKTTGIVTDSRITKNTISNNGAPAIQINQCKNISFSDNLVIVPSAADPVVNGEMAEKYTSGLSFENNTYRLSAGQGPLLFKLHDTVFTGVPAFNEYTGGSDREG